MPFSALSFRLHLDIRGNEGAVYIIDLIERQAKIDVDSPTGCMISHDNDHRNNATLVVLRIAISALQDVSLCPYQKRHQYCGILPLIPCCWYI